MRKIKVEKQIYRNRKNKQMTWGDIKHLEFEDDDVIRAGWEEDEGFDYHGYWHGEITRMVEETDEEYEKRVEDTKKFAANSKKRRLESYLKLKKEFENE